MEVDMEMDFDKEMEYIDSMLKNVEKSAADENIGWVGMMAESSEMEGNDTPKNGVGIDEIVVLPKECEVNEMAYYGMGTWFLTNWRSTSELRERPANIEDKYDDDSDLESVAMLTPNLTLFSIVGTLEARERDHMASQEAGGELLVGVQGQEEVQLGRL